MNRRRFLENSVLGSVFIGSGYSMINGTLLQSESLDVQEHGVLKEKSRKIPVSGEYDVIVAGGGPAGVSAAIEAGRCGAKTLLLEAHGCLGGIWTSGLLTWILDHNNKEGFIIELKTKLLERGASISENVTNHHISFNPEAMKYLLEELCLDANVDLLFHARAVGSTKDNRNRMNHVITESKSGREAWKAKMFIDATGDGDLAAVSGCGFDFGDPVKGSFQPFSLLAILSGINLVEIGSRSLTRSLAKAGYTPSYLRAGLFPISNNLFMMMANQVYGCSPMNALHVTKATIQARKEVSKIVEALKSLGSPWNNIMLVATGEQIGTREGRRIHGLYTLTQSDLEKGSKFEDAVCSTKYGVNVHNVSAEDHEGNVPTTMGITVKEYDIPLRSLIAKDLGGLMMAGRCISGDFIAHSSYRVTGNAVTMGHAAGRVAAISSKRNALPQDIEFKIFDL